MEEILTTFGVDVKLLVIQAINFGLLLLVLWKFLYHPVMRTLEERESKIAQGVKDADVAKERLGEIETERETTLKNATTEAEHIVTEAKERAHTKEEELVKEAQAKGERILDDARKKADEAQRQALAESQSEIARLAILGAEKILKEKM